MIEFTLHAGHYIYNCLTNPSPSFVRKWLALRLILQSSTEKLWPSQPPSTILSCSTLIISPHDCFFACTTSKFRKLPRALGSLNPTTNLPNKFVPLTFFSPLILTTLSLLYHSSSSRESLERNKLTTHLWCIIWRPRLRNLRKNFPWSPWTKSYKTNSGWTWTTILQDRAWSAFLLTIKIFLDFTVYPGPYSRRRRLPSWYFGLKSGPIAYTIVLNHTWRSTRPF